MKYAVIAALLLSCGGLQPTAPRSVVPDAIDATIVITKTDGTVHCAGVFVGAYVLTAAHCVDPAQAALVHLHGSGLNMLAQTFSFAVAEYDKDLDVAVLAPSEVLPAHASAILAPTDPEPGDRVVIIGHPMRQIFSLSEGIASGVRHYGDGGTIWLQVSAPISPGNSGGPVFNQYGEVIGIVAKRLESSEGAEAHLALAVPLDTLRTALGSDRP